MKYRRLSTEELKELEPEFIKFLAANGIPGDDWEKIKLTDTARMDELVDQFSDMVMERALSNIKFIEHLTPKNLKVFYCLEKKIVMVGIDIDGDDDMDFTKPESLKKLTQLNAGNPLKIYKTEKEYDGNREEEVYKMLSQGCQIITKERFEAIDGLHVDLKVQQN